MSESKSIINLAELKAVGNVSATDRRNIADFAYAQVAKEIDDVVNEAKDALRTTISCNDEKNYGVQVSSILSGINTLLKTKLSVVSEFVNNVEIVEQDDKEKDVKNLSSSAFDELIGED